MPPSAEDKLDQIVATLTELRIAFATMTAELKTANDRGVEHETRIRDLEAWRWKAVGAAAAAGGIASIIANHLP
jgi:hypothetical protein